MRKGEALSLLGKAAAVMLATALSACGTTGPSLPAPHLVGSRDLPDNAMVSHALLDAPSDMASLPDEPSDAYDPYEKMNRAIFERNQRFNRSVTYPLASTYRNAVPQPVRTSIENFVSNLAEPMVFVNDVLQLRPKAAVATAGRFAVNSTIGLAGVADVATRQNLPQQSGDFGQTLYVWGVRKSPYLFLPVIGPTNVRDLFGTTLEFAATIPAGNLLPSQIASTVNGVTMAGTIATPFTELDDVADMRDLEENSLDFYVMLRSVVEQKRQAELEEALRTSGWTAARYRSDSSGVTPATEVEALAPTPAPQTPSQEFMVGAFRGANG
jgi:phospholipid-binding lipoprotein MlaA